MNPERWDELLLDLATGGRTADDPEVRELMRTNPEFRRRYEEQARVRLAMDEVGREDRVLAQVSDQPAPAEDEALAGFRAIIDGTRRDAPTPGRDPEAPAAGAGADAPRAPTFPWRWTVAAAAVVAAVLWWPAPEQPSPEPRPSIPGVLGGEHLVEVWPTRYEEGIDHVRWELKDPGMFVELRFTDLEGNEIAPGRVISPPGNRYELPAGFPEAFRWTIVVREARSADSQTFVIEP